MQESRSAITTAFYHYNSLYKQGMKGKYPSSVDYIPPILEGLTTALKEIERYDEIVKFIVIKGDK